MLELVTIGHVTLDQIRTGRRQKRFVAGGSTVHTSLAAASLGATAASLKVERLGPDLIRDLGKLVERASTVFSEVQHLERS